MHRPSRALRCRTVGSVLAAFLLTTVAFPAAAQKVSNPFANAKGYVNPDWAAKANAESGGSRISNQPTAIWLDHIAAIAGDGAMGLQAHLDNALATGAGYIEFVIYDLPGRDCAALSSNGELGPTDLATYKSSYIDPIAALETSSKYASLRIVNIIEPDSLPNLVTNAGSQSGATAACATMLANGNYVAGVQYALSKLGNSSNIYNYIDIGHHGWLGWDTNFGPAATLIANTVKGATGGANTIAGMIANTANYCATTEPYFTINDSVNGTSVRQSKWVDWNYYVDEQSYGVAFTKQVGANLGRSDLGTLIDTSRNGWGGSARPTGPGPTTSVDAYVDGGRIDRRLHAGNWCNQVGAGIGARPTAAPASGVHAYVWIKPPGESDGSDHVTTATRGLDGMCDPNYAGNARNGNNKTGAMANSPIAGAWFSAQFQALMANAYPPLSGSSSSSSSSSSGSSSSGSSSSGGSACSAAPPAVTTLTAQVVSSSQINLSWNAVTPPANCAVTYNVYRSTTSGFTPSTSNRIASGLTTTSRNDTGLAASTTYYYAVQATDLAGSAAVARVSGTTSSGTGTSFTLTVAKGGTGAGTVTSSPAGISCGSTCSASFANTVTVTLTAAATSGTFTGWGGACSGTASTCTLAMSQARSVSANFTLGNTGGSCDNPLTFTGNTNNFNTTGAVCYRTSATINGWGCYNMDGRTITNGGATRTCGALPLTRSSDGYTYFAVSAGTYAWAGIYTY